MSAAVSHKQVIMKSSKQTGGRLVTVLREQPSTEVLNSLSQKDPNFHSAHAMFVATPDGAYVPVDNMKQIDQHAEVWVMLDGETPPTTDSKG